ncbi:hypothetical protein [Aequorivita sinensis]|uniref:hypothetical protein n=1 Tax=Aequorivita sinensis TaxID=1382458 RepID=UPI0022FFE763|nr:hypothetical protein [Aequorivita sinensis]
MNESLIIANLFSEILLDVNLSKNLNTGVFKIGYNCGVITNTILPNSLGLNDDLHNYKFSIMKGDLETSLELCESRNYQ